MALVLCVALMLGCTAVRAEETNSEDGAQIFSFPQMEEALAYSAEEYHSNPTLCAVLIAYAYAGYRSFVDDAYEADFTQPFYIGVLDSDTPIFQISFFSEDGHCIKLIPLGSLVGYFYDTNTSSDEESYLTAVCEWTYKMEPSTITKMLDFITQGDE